ncbi:site-specific integrase [Thiotrichales bacterium 19X7-9]|nr:site-specific integrase [Thiotrichales bacterium 19X7-9]
MPTIKFTKLAIDAITASTKRVDYFDTDVKGLSLRVSPSGSKTYSIIYRNAQGIKKRYTIGKHGAITMNQAKKEAQRLLLHVSQGEDVQEIKSVAQRTQATEDYTFKNYIDDFYLEWCRANRKDAKNVSLILLNTCSPLHDIVLKDLNQAIVNQFLMRYQKKTGITNSRINKILNGIKGAISRAFEYGYVEKNILQGLKTLKESVGKIRYLSEVETQRLFKALEDTNELIRNIVLTAYYTGMRRGEIFSLKWEDIDLKLNQIILDKDNTKSGKIRDIPLNSKLREIFINLPEPKTGLVFKSPKTGDKLDNIKKSWATLMKKAEIENFRFHDLRHNFASQLVMKGESLSVVRELLGHSDFKMTLRYAHLAPEHKQRAVDLL